MKAGIIKLPSGGGLAACLDSTDVVSSICVFYLLSKHTYPRTHSHTKCINVSYPAAVPKGHSGVPAHSPLRCRDEHSLLWGPESVVA
jgi:hypothetical protein